MERGSASMNATVEDAGYEYVNIPVDFIKITHIQKRWNVIYTLASTGTKKNIIHYFYKFIWKTDSIHVHYGDALARVQQMLRYGCVQQLQKKNQTFRVARQVHSL